MQQVAVWVLALLGASALLGLAPALLALQRHERWTALLAIVLVVGGLASELFPTDALRLGMGLVFALGACLLPVVDGHRDRRGIQAPDVLLVVLWLYLFLVNFASSPSFSAAVMRIASLTVVVGAVVLSARGVDGLRPFAIAILTAIALVAIALPLLPNVWKVCRETKCGIAEGLLAGPFSSENVMGIVAGLTIALAWSLPGRRLRALGFLIGTVWLIAAASRTSALVVGLCVLATWLVRHPFVRIRSRFLPSRGAYAYGLAISTLTAVVAWLLLHNSAPDSFSGRGAVWANGIAALQGQEVFGRGLDSWSDYNGGGAVSHHFMHSEFLYILFSGGVIGLLLFVTLLAAVIGAAARGGFRFIPRSTFLLTFVGISLLEVTWNPLTLDSTSWLGVALLLARSPTESSRGEHVALSSTPAAARPFGPTRQGVPLRRPNVEGRAGG